MSALPRVCIFYHYPHLYLYRHAQLTYGLVATVSPPGTLEESQLLERVLSLSRFVAPGLLALCDRIHEDLIVLRGAHDTRPF